MQPIDWGTLHLTQGDALRNLCNFIFIQSQTVSLQRGVSLILQLMSSWIQITPVPPVRRAWEVYSASPGVHAGRWNLNQSLQGALAPQTPNRVSIYLPMETKILCIPVSSALQGDQKKYLRQWWGCSGKHQEPLEARCCGFKTLKTQRASLKEMFPKQSEKNRT